MFEKYVREKFEKSCCSDEKYDAMQWLVYVPQTGKNKYFLPYRWVLSGGAKQGKVILHQNLILCTKF